MRWDELPSYEIGFEKGVEKGIEKGRVKIVIKMLPVFNDKKIHEYTGVSLSDIKKIRKENS